MRYQKINLVRNSAVLFLFVLFVFPAYTQTTRDKYINLADPAFRSKYETLVFNDKFVLLAESDRTNNYYIADFSKFKSRFEKVYFLNLVFKSEKIVNLEGDLKQQRIWFLANKQYPVKEITGLFDELKGTTVSISTAYSEEEKAGWLKENDKYK